MSRPYGSVLERALSTEPELGHGHGHGHWHGHGHAQDDVLAERILDATVQEAALGGLRRLAIDDVARRAGTTRMTVYRRFGRREQLIEAMAVRETRRFIEALTLATAHARTIEEQGAEAFVSGLRFMHAHPVARRAIDSEPEAIVLYLQAEDGRLFDMARDFVAAGLRAAGVEPVRVDPAAETMVRLFVSFLLLPRSVVPMDDADAVRRYVRSCIAPLVSS
jgi:AcrR family transcriptional regulator